MASLVRDVTRRATRTSNWLTRHDISDALQHSLDEPITVHDTPSNLSLRLRGVLKTSIRAPRNLANLRADVRGSGWPC